MLEAKADVNARTIVGNTPAMLAACTYIDKTDLMEILCDYGADLMMENNGVTPYTRVKGLGHEKLATFILRQTAPRHWKSIIIDSLHLNRAIIF